MALLEFLVGLVKILWLVVVGAVKAVLPVIRKKDVSKEIVLVTGAGSGIGRLMALQFAKLGATLVLWDINESGNDAVRDEIKASGGTAHAFKVDCSKRESVYEGADKVRDEVGDVTILINNAGIVSGKTFYDIPDHLADLTFQVNAVAHFWTLKAFFPAMKKNNHGYVITIASSAGLFGVASLMDYCGSKFAAVGIHESLASEISTLKLDGIKTTLVCPFYINTGMFDGVKTRIPALLPILEPEYAVGKIMDAFHSDQYMLMMPKIIYLFYMLQGFLPKEAMLLAGDLVGANSSMNTFKGREKKE